MEYHANEHTLGTRGAIGCVAILTIIGLFLVWAFFEEVRMPELIYEGPPIGEFPPKEEEVPTA